ncbi:MFS transporter [Thermodesulfobacteriota bacterium]
MKKPRIFWGWYIVAAGVALSAYNSGMFVYGFTAFIGPIAATFGWSYAQISLATSLRGLESGALNPLLGVLVDRWPSKRLVLIGVIILGIGVIWVSQAASLVMFYIGFLFLGLGSSLAAFMVPQATMVRWFEKDIGKASGVLAMGMGISGAFIPVTVRLIDAFGWQQSLIFLAFGMFAIGIPLSFVFRSRPEDYGLLPDGKPQTDIKRADVKNSYGFGTTTGDAIRMRAFWHIGIACTLQMSAVMAVNTHVMPYLESIGIERTTAGTVAMFIPLTSLIARFPFGFLCDIVVKKYVMALALLLKSIGLICFWFLGNGHPELILPCVIFFGLGSGGMTAPRTPILREYFGTKNFGTIFGLTSIFFTIGMVISPTLAGWVFDSTGSYQPVWLAMSGTTLAGAIIIITAPHARKGLASVVDQS